MLIVVVTDKEDDSVEPVVTEDESDEEEGDSEENSYTSNEMDEMVDFFSDGRFASVKTGSETSDTTHNSIVSAADDDTLSGT